MPPISPVTISALLPGLAFDQWGALAINDTLINDTSDENRPRQMFVLEETGFKEVPKKFRRFYRKWAGSGDSLAPNEVLCPVCKIVIRSLQELRVGDKVYCMPCMSRLIVEEENDRLVAKINY